MNDDLARQRIKEIKRLLERWESGDLYISPIMLLFQIKSLIDKNSSPAELGDNM